MVPLTDILPESRKGPLGDVYKVYCATCHQGAYKPLYGAPMAKDYPALKAPAPEQTTPEQAAQAEEPAPPQAAAAPAPVSEVGEQSAPETSVPQPQPPRLRYPPPSMMHYPPAPLQYPPAPMPR